LAIGSAGFSAADGAGGDAAILVDPYDVAQIADAMRLALTQPALAAGAAGEGPGPHGAVYLGAHGA
jgi:hypothetical protein